jgi:PAS domain S-box-containing protein
MGTLLDVTERHEYERRLERSRAEYRDLFESVPDAVFVRPPGGTFQAVNDAAVDRLGYDREALLSMRPRDIDPTLEGSDDDRVEQFDHDEIRST